MNMTIDPHTMALHERRMRSITQAHRMFWVPVDLRGYVFHVGIQISTKEDLENISLVDTSKIVDKLPQDMLISNTLDIIMISDNIFNYVAEHYQDHDIIIDVVNYDQPVLSTKYNFNNPPF